jgi:sarcosine oxidase gamma subunit
MPEIRTVKSPEKKDQEDLSKILHEVSPLGTQSTVSGMFPNEWYILDQKGQKIALVNMELGYIAMIQSGEVPKWVVQLAEKIEEQPRDHQGTIVIFLH